MKQINYKLLLFETVFALLVIFAHTSFTVGEYHFDSLGRATVVFFFMMSGYFYSFAINKEDYKYKSTLKRCLRLLIIQAIALAIYLPTVITMNIVQYGYPVMGNNIFITIMSFFDKYVTNMAFLWFINALIICYLLFPLISKLKVVHKKWFIVVPIFILIGIYIYRIFAGKYNFGFFSEIIVTRNALLTGIPCFLIALHLKEYLQDYKYALKIKGPIFILCVLICLGVIMLEAFLHISIGTKNNEFYLFSIVLSILCLTHSINYPKCSIGEKIYLIGGKTMPTIIYLSHIMFLLIFGCVKLFPYAEFVQIVLTIFAAILLGTLYHRIKIKVIKKAQ